jgi:23S rRNA (pseudouridine1915-N3)-methyltransferase
MRVAIIAVGRARAGPERDLYDSYVKRLRWPVDLREVEEKRPLPPAELKEREAELLLAAIPGDAVAVALDGTGKDMTSEALAEKLSQWRDDGRGCVAFVIGGADGLAPEIRDRADLLVAFGRQTWPHMLVRAMLAEQIYRAQQILAGHPYHRG